MPQPTMTVAGIGTCIYCIGCGFCGLCGLTPGAAVIASGAATANVW